MSSDLPPPQVPASAASEPPEVAELRAWVAAKARDLPPQGLTDDLPLLRGRHLTSLHMPELILLLERLRGRPVDIAALQAGDFQDVRTLAARFLGAETAAVETAAVETAAQAGAAPGAAR